MFGDVTTVITDDHPSTSSPHARLKLTPMASDDGLPSRQVKPADLTVAFTDSPGLTVADDGEIDCTDAVAGWTLPVAIAASSTPAAAIQPRRARLDRTPVIVPENRQHRPEPANPGQVRADTGR
jgi:hypothetical protein